MIHTHRIRHSFQSSLCALVACMMAACGGGGTDSPDAEQPIDAAAHRAWASDAPIPAEPAADSPPSAEMPDSRPAALTVQAAADPADAQQPPAQTLAHATGLPPDDTQAQQQRMHALAAADRTTTGSAATGQSAPAITPADIVYALNPADLTTYRYSTLACLGGNKYWWEWGGSSGRYLTTTLFPLRDGTGMQRASVVADPDDRSSRAFELSVMPTDADTSGSGNKRCELALGWKEYRYPGKVLARTTALPRNRDFWWSIKFRLADWRATRDRQVIFQWLPGFSTTAGPILGLDVWGNTLRLEIHYDSGAAPSETTMTKLIPWTLTRWQPNRWYTMVFRARIDAATPAGGKLVMWLDGAQVLDYRGPIGFTVPTEGDYVKFGPYHWTGNNPWDLSVVKRTGWYKGPALILDRAGYTPAAIAAAIK